MNQFFYYEVNGPCAAGFDTRAEALAWIKDQRATGVLMNYDLAGSNVAVRVKTEWFSRGRAQEGKAK